MTRTSVHAHCKRAIQRELETPLSKRLLSGDVKTGDTIVASFTPEEGTSFTVEKTAAGEPGRSPGEGRHRNRISPASHNHNHTRKPPFKSGGFSILAIALHGMANEAISMIDQ